MGRNKASESIALADRVLITGVSSGIGAGLTAEYLSRGARVWGASRRHPSDRLLGHENFRFQPVDLAIFESVADNISLLLQDCNQLDLVVLNAGVLGQIGDLRSADMAQLRHVMDVNVWSNKFVLDALANQDRIVRQVVTISSGAAVNGNRGWGGYSISKAALNMLTKIYAREMTDTHFAAVAPGLVDTAMQDYLCDHPADERFPSLDVLKSKRKTPEMPGPEQIAKRLVRVFEQLPTMIESGEFVDIRNLPND